MMRSTRETRSQAQASDEGDRETVLAARGVHAPVADCGEIADDETLQERGVRRGASCAPDLASIFFSRHNTKRLIGSLQFAR